MNRPKTKWSKNNPRPRVIGYKVAPTRQRFPLHLFDKSKSPIHSAMERFYKRRRHYPAGITPIYENNNERKEDYTWQVLRCII